MAKLQWQNVAPADTSNYLDAIARANQQTQAGLGGIQEAFKGYYGDLKDRNTNEMLTILNGAQNQEQLGLAQQQIAALQQKYGSGYDINKVRDAVDMRPTVLNQRAMEALQYQQAKAQNDAIPMVNEAMAGLVNSRQGITPEQQAIVSKIAQAGYDTTGILNTLGNTIVGDFRDNRTYITGRNDRAEDVQWRKDQAERAQKNWQADYDYREDESNWNRGGQIAAENPGGNTLTYQDGKWVTVTTPKITRMDAYGALSGVRGIRNNNPGNIEFYNQPGATIESKGGRFARFSTPEQGINAMSKQLDLYFTGKSQNVTKPINTIQDIITTWAPPKNKKGQVENNTAAYIASVAKAMGVSPTAKLNLNDPNTKAALMSAMITHENGGNPYTYEQYIAGITGNTATNTPASVGGGGSTAATATGISLPMASYQKILASYEDNKLKWNMERQKKDQPLDPARFNQIDPKAERNWFNADSRDVIDQIKKNPLSNNLDLASLQKVYGAANDWMQSAKGYENINGSGNGNLAKQISILLKNESNQVAKQRKHDDSANHPLNAAVQQLQQEFRALGGSISRADAIMVLDREHYDNYYAPKESKAAKQVQKVAAKTTTNKPVVKAEPKKVAETVKQVAKPTKQEVVDYFVKKGGKSDVIPNGLNPKQDRQLIQEARLQAAKVIANQKKQQESAKEAQEKLRAQKAKAEKAKLDKQFNDMQLRKFAAQRKKEEEEKQKKAQSKFYGLKS